MIIRDQLCAPGFPSRPNEDIGGGVPESGMAWVIDGATGLAPSPLIAKEGSTDAQWFSHTAHALLQHVLKQGGLDTSNPEMFARQALHAALSMMMDAFDKDKTHTPSSGFDMPCASMCLLHSPVEGDIHCLGLGDCTVILETPDGIRACEGDPVLAALDAVSCAEAAPYLAKGMSFPEVRDSIGDTLKKHRNLLNQDDGYWIFSLTLECLKNMWHHTFPKQVGGHALIMSDGFYALIDKYGKYTHETLLEKCKAVGLPALYEELRFIEQEEDPLCTKYIRLKQCDDATAVFLQL